MKYAVVTGASRGLGESIAKLLIQSGIKVIGVARSINEQLMEESRDYPGSYEHEICDLSNPVQVEKTFTSIATRVFSEQPECVYLINNAGMVEPIEQARNYKVADLTSHVHVNLIAPMASSTIFLRETEVARIPLVVTNVTSGAANRSVYGWSAYCSTKAGLDRYTDTVAIEQAELGTGNKIILYNPGIMDTNMQGDIRSSSKQAFKDVDTFKQYKKENSLRETSVVAGALIDVLKDFDSIENGKYYNVKELLV